MNLPFTAEAVIMTIHLPENLESSILKAVHSGKFASLDDAMATAARLLLEKLEQAVPPYPEASEAAPKAHKTIWEEIEEITAGVPDEEFLKLPVDGAEQHDHYIYGTPKRPDAQ